jgi:hypothetical protein
MDTSEPKEWLQVRSRLLSRFSHLTVDDLELVAGREETLLDTIALKTGCTREAVIDAFSALGMFRAR